MEEQKRRLCSERHTYYTDFASGDWAVFVEESGQAETPLFCVTRAKTKTDCERIVGILQRSTEGWTKFFVKRLDSDTMLFFKSVHGRLIGWVDILIKKNLSDQ